jgi:hypothetical protein
MLLSSESHVAVGSQWMSPGFKESFAFLLVLITGPGSLECRCLWSAEQVLSFSKDDIALVRHIKRQEREGLAVLSNESLDVV